jgi:hypothetical protein
MQESFPTFPFGSEDVNLAISFMVSDLVLVTQQHTNRNPMLRRMGSRMALFLEQDISDIRFLYDFSINLHPSLVCDFIPISKKSFSKRYWTL